MSTLVSSRMPQVLFCKAAFQQLDPSIYQCMGLFLPAAGLCTSLCWIAQGCSWLMAPACQGPSESFGVSATPRPCLCLTLPDAAHPAYFPIASPPGDSFSTAAHLLHKIRPSLSTSGQGAALGTSSNLTLAGLPFPSEALSGLKSLLWGTGTPVLGNASCGTPPPHLKTGYSELRWQSLLCTVPEKLLHLLAVSDHP